MKKFLSVVCALVMVLGLMSVTAYAAELTDGVFEGTGKSFGGDLKVAVTVEGGKITKVEVLSHGDTAGVCDAAMEKIPAAIVEAQSADVDVVTGATLSSNGIMAAVKNALGLEEAAEQVCTISDPDVLVIGAGVAGMRTAIEACRNGAKVVVLEKTDRVGGTIGGGTLIGINSKLQALYFVLRRLAKIRIEDDRARLFSCRILGEIVRIALPSTLQQSFISVGNIVIQSVVNSFGASVMAGYSAAIKLNNLVITSFTTLGNGISNYTGQNLGADKPDRVRAGFKAGVRMVWLLCVPLVALYLLCGEALIRFFMNAPSVLAVESGLQLLRVVAPFYFVVSVKLAADGVLRGAEMMRAFMVSTLTDLVLRVALAVFLSGGMGTLGVWSAWPIGWCVATGLSLLFYLRKFKKQPVAA